MSQATRPWAVLSLFLCSLLQAAPPRVVKTVPPSGSEDVDPATTQVRIEFDQPMSPTGFSIVGGGKQVPDVAGQPSWIGDRVFVLPVKLQPGRDYRFSVNSETASGFRNRNQVPVQPTVIRFNTLQPPLPPAPKEVRARNAAAAALLRKLIDENYSYRDLRQVDWTARFARFEPWLLDAPDAASFAHSAARLLSAAGDLHIWLDAGGQRFATHIPDTVPNVRVDLLGKRVGEWKQLSRQVATGVVGEGIRYVMIGAWDNEQTVRDALAAIRLADPRRGLIIDVRMNGGGNELLGRAVAGCFVDDRTVYARHVIVKDGTPGKPMDRAFQPNPDGPKYRGPIALLIGPKVVSSSESFVKMIDGLPGAVTIGARTGGASGNPQPYELGNGVTVFLPSWRDLMPDGTAMEGRGIEPRIAVEATIADLVERDPVLERAITELSKWR